MTAPKKKIELEPQLTEQQALIKEQASSNQDISGGNIKEEDLLSVPLSSVQVGGNLPYPIYVRIGLSFILFRPTGDILDTERYEQLKRSIDSVFIPRESWLNYLKTLESEQDFKLGSIEEAQHFCDMILAFQRTFDKQNADKFTAKELDKMKGLGNRLSLSIIDRPDRAGSLLRRFEEKTLYYLNHNINVAIYATVVGMKLGLTQEDLKKLTFSALTHNLGNIFIPEYILYKKEQLTPEEWRLVQSHPRLGAELLKGLKAPKEAILTALQHHERFDGQGYPSKTQGPDLHLFAKICTIADVYDALTNCPPYRKREQAGKAIEKMSKMVGKFDPSLLKMVGK